MPVVVELARAEDDAGIRALLRRQAMPGRVSLALHHEPSFSAGCAVTGSDHRIVVARDESGGHVVGVACRAVRQVFLNGTPRRVGYLGQLRVADGFHGRWLIARGFALLRRLDAEDPLPLYLAAIVDGNEQASGVLVTRRRKSFPQLREAARYRTLAIPVGRRKPELPGQDTILPGSRDQLPAIVRFLQHEGRRRQLFSVWTEEALVAMDALGLRIEDMRIARRDGSIVGVVALWDQGAFRQTVVRGYSGWLKAAAPLLRVSPSWLAPPLPRIGDRIRSAYASLICVARDDAGVFARLLREIYNLASQQRFDYLLAGLDTRDPLLQVARSYRHIAYPSRLFLGSWHSSGAAHDPLDGRPSYVDIATL